MLDKRILTFIKIYECGSLTAAATSLRLSVSVVGNHLQHLEEELGVKLILRTTRKLMPTSAGGTFYQSCKRLEKDACHALEELSRQTIEPSGRITISAPSGLLEKAVTPIISNLAEKHPKLKPAFITQDNSSKALQDDVDIAISVCELKDSDLKSFRIGSFRRILCVSPNYIKSRKHGDMDNIPLEVFQNWNHLAPTWKNPVINYNMTHFKTGDPLQFTIESTRFTNSTLSAHALILNNGGIAALPDYVVKKDLETGKLIRLLPDYQFKKTSVYACHPYGNQLPARVRLCLVALTGLV
jgi:DNA-binding transcriptional LysR family regulator